MRLHADLRKSRAAVRGVDAVLECGQSSPHAKDAQIRRRHLVGIRIGAHELHHWLCADRESDRDDHGQDQCDHETRHQDPVRLHLFLFAFSTCDERRDRNVDRGKRRQAEQHRLRRQRHGSHGGRAERADHLRVNERRAGRKKRFHHCRSGNANRFFHCVF